MLEMTYSWSEWRIEERRRGKRDGVIEGKIIGQVEIWKILLRREKQYQRLLEQGKEVPKALESMHEYYIEKLESEKEAEILKIIQKYPNYSHEQLAKRILWESEYWR
jgi:hypothetical protein